MKRGCFFYVHFSEKRRVGKVWQVAPYTGAWIERYP